MKINTRLFVSALAFALATTVASGATYPRDLTFGSVGDDVATLQTFLESEGFLTVPAGVPKGYFGPLTQGALSRFQAAWGIRPTGYFGPITRGHVGAAESDSTESRESDSDSGSDTDTDDASSDGDSTGSGAREKSSSRGAVGRHASGSSGSSALPANTVNIGEESGENDDRIVYVEDGEETEDQEVLRFGLSSPSRDNVLESISIDLSVAEATTTTIADLVSEVSLEVGGVVIATATPDAVVGTTTVTFEGLGLSVLNNGGRATTTVLANFKQRDGNYAEGISLTAHVGADGVVGSSFTSSGEVAGGNIELLVPGIGVELVNAETVQVLAADPGTPGSADAYSFRIQFEVTAEGDDVYIDKSVIASSSPSVAGSGAGWATTSESTIASTQTTGTTLTASGSAGADTVNVFKISDGVTRTFTLSVALTATADGSTAVKLTGINWTRDSGDTTPNNYYTSDLEDFATELQYMSFI